VDFSALGRFLRPATLPAPLTGVMGGAIAAWGGWPANWNSFWLASASALLLTAASNGLNQICDLETDRINRPERPLPSEELTPVQAAASTALFAVAALLLAAAVNRYFFWCVAATAVVTAAYSVPPLRTKRFPFLANATIATPRGLLLVVAGWAVGGGFHRTEAWVLGGLAWLYIFGASTTKDFADVEGDRATGCRTLPIVLGPQPAARFVAVFLVLPYVLYPAAAAVGLLPGGPAPWGLLGALLALLGLLAARFLLRDPGPPANGRPHPAWGLMYAQLALAPIGAAAIFVCLGP